MSALMKWLYPDSMVMLGIERLQISTLTIALRRTRRTERESAEPVAYQGLGPFVLQRLCND